ncbi:hypothetical protein GF377_01965, partial [candidate division GN15 bacterium]|nr:hypothetical protein [candidate division GN15 bacterium]
MAKKSKSKKKASKTTSRTRSARRSGTVVRQPAGGDPRVRLAVLEERLDANPADIPAALDVADMYGRIGKESQIVDILKPIEPQYPFDDTRMQAAFDRLMAYGYAHQG